MMACNRCGSYTKDPVQSTAGSVCEPCHRVVRLHAGDSVSTTVDGYPGPYEVVSVKRSSYVYLRVGGRTVGFPMNSIR